MYFSELYTGILNFFFQFDMKILNFRHNAYSVLLSEEVWWFSSDIIFLLYNSG